jgi:phosphoserine phosphatase
MIAESHFVSLVSDPARPAIATALLARLEMELPEAMAPVWLDEGVAADIGFTPPPGADLAALAGTLRGMLGDAPIDLNVLAAGGRRKRLFVADMDSTMIDQECIDELADFAGLKAHVAAITERAMRGEIAFEPAVRERVALLRDLPVSVVAETLEGRITLTPGGATLVRTMRAAGGYAALVSGGFTVFTGAIAERIGFDEHRGNVLDFADGLFAGTVAEPILGREAKLATLIELRERLGLAHGETLAVGDGANDLAMLQEAGLGVAFRAKPAVAAAAHARVQHGDLTALLYLQGYRRDEFVES